MKKLNKKKIKWVIREFEKREIGVYTIAKTQDITPQHVYRVYKKYKNVEDPILLKPGREVVEITKQEKDLIEKTYKEYYLGAVIMETILDEKNIHIPHNRIHSILKEKGLAKDESKKQKQRKWVRYERRHSLSLVHSDWFEYKGWKIMLIEDDASRFITGYGKFKHATKENAIKVLRRSLKWGNPKQFHTDHGSVYTSNDQEGKKKGESDFEKELKKIGIQLILAKVKHPQSNGKLEKLIHTIKKLWEHTGSFEKAIKLYNYKRPHMSLTTSEGKLRTPYQAFLDKRRKK